MQILKLINSFSAFVAPLANNVAIISPNIKILEEEKRVLTFIKDFLTEDSKELESIAKQLDIKFSAKKNIGRKIINKPYTQGGVGGANTHFKNKNLKTGKIKTLEGLLKLNNFELIINSLLRVKDLNKVKWDNLG